MGVNLIAEHMEKTLHTHTHILSLMPTGTKHIHTRTNTRTICARSRADTQALVTKKYRRQRVFTFGGEIEHVVTAEGREHPEGVGGVQQRGTALSQSSSESQGEEYNAKLFKRFFSSKKKINKLYT